MSNVVGKLDKDHLSVGSFKSRTCEQGIQYRHLFGGDPREEWEDVRSEKEAIQGYVTEAIALDYGVSSTETFEKGPECPQTHLYR